MQDRRKFIKHSLAAGAGISVLGMPGLARTLQEEALRIGIIGLDTSHSPAFTKYIHNPDNTHIKGARVVAAFPYGSRTIEASYTRIPEYTEQMKEMGVTITQSIEEMLDQVDAIMLETNDGTVHLEQALAVFRAGKPMFIDKPAAAGLEDVIRIYEAAEEYDVPMFSASSLRYLAKAQKVRHEGIIGKVTGASTFSPEKWEPSHTDLFWYGIHGVEILYTVMGTGCRRLKRILSGDTDLVIGEWAGWRLGTFRGDLQGRQHYGGTAFGTEGVMELGPFDGYGALVDQVISFFRTGISPVEANETIELYTFMQAADVSKAREGAWVDLEEVFETAKANADQ